MLRQPLEAGPASIASFQTDERLLSDPCLTPWRSASCLLPLPQENKRVGLFAEEWHAERHAGLVAPAKRDRSCMQEKHDPH